MKYLNLILLAFVFVLTACPKNIPPPKNALSDPSEIRQAINARFENLDSIRFKEVVLEYFGKNERVKIRQLILVKKPTLLRIQTRLPGSEEILSLLVSDGKTFALHKRDSNEYFHGNATPKNIGILLPVDLSARDLVRILFGGAPWDRFDSFSQNTKPKLTWDGKSGSYLYSIHDEERSLEMLIRHTDFAVIEVQEKRGGKIVYQYRTEDWKKYGQTQLPSWIRFVWPERDLDFSLTVRETQLNVDLPDILFELEPPGGSRVIHVDNP